MNKNITNIYNYCIKNTKKTTDTYSTNCLFKRHTGQSSTRKNEEKEGHHQLTVHFSLTSHIKQSSSSTHYTYLYACTFLCNSLSFPLFFFSICFETGLGPAKYAHYLQSWMSVNDACHHCITNNSSIIYLQSLQKKKVQ